MTIKTIRKSICRFVGRIFNLRYIKRNKQAKIAVHLHLFYPKMWKEIKEYLKNLNIYNYKLYITFPLSLDENIVSDIKKIKPDAIFMPLENRGYDIGPFMEFVSKVELDDFDIVIKLHSKRKSPRERFMYNNLFRKKDWFLYLFNGVVGSFNIHKTIDSLLADNKIGMVSAQNLIVADPAHKQRFVEKYLDELNISKLKTVTKSYKFVAGTCFAVRSSLLAELKTLNITIDSFPLTKRNGFSLAHALERIICMYIYANGYMIAGNKACIVKKFLNKKREQKLISLSANRLHQDDRFVIDDQFFYTSLEEKKIAKYEVDEVPLSELKRRWFDGELYDLDQLAPFKYLSGDKNAYERYSIFHQMHPKLPDMSAERFDELIKSMDKNGFDSKHLIITYPNNVIMDGQHRACYLLHKYGRDHIVKILRLYFV